MRRDQSCLSESVAHFWISVRRMCPVLCRGSGHCDLSGAVGESAPYGRVVAEGEKAPRAHVADGVELCRLLLLLLLLL